MEEHLLVQVAACPVAREGDYHRVLAAAFHLGRVAVYRLAPEAGFLVDQEEDCLVAPAVGCPRDPEGDYRL